MEFSDHPILVTLCEEESNCSSTGVYTKLPRGRSYSMTWFGWANTITRRKRQQVYPISSKRSSTTAEITRDADDVDLRSLKVIRRCANRCGTYDFLLALNSNLTSIFNLCWNIMPSLHIHTPPLFQVEMKKTDGSRWTCFGIKGA